MNEQPQPQQLPPVDHQEGDQPLYRSAGAPTSSFSGYDLASAPQSVPQELPVAPPAATNQQELTWEASEYIHHTKTPLWFIGYICAMLALFAIAYFLINSITFVILVVVMAVAIGVFATRPPRVLHYTLSDLGVQIENTHYSYSDFRSFGVIADGALYSVMLIPTKRFMPAVSMYFAEEDGEKIVDILGARLPMQELHLDVIDRIVRRLRF